MICVAISEPDINKCIKTLDEVEMAEIRMDLTGFNTEEIKRVFSHRGKAKTIATCRLSADVDSRQQYEKLVAAMEAGAAYVDIEIEVEKDSRDDLIAIAGKMGTKVIISYHNFSITPPAEELSETVNRCYDAGADIAKITTMVNQVSDNARILSLYGSGKPLVAFGMGDKGMISRIMAPFLGAVFTFASMDDGRATAPGQIPYSRLKNLLHTIEEQLK